MTDKGGGLATCELPPLLSGSGRFGIRATAAWPWRAQVFAEQPGHLDSRPAVRTSGAGCRSFDAQGPQ
jgi:hypothetical protein